jgi:hypothetical protein
MFFTSNWQNRQIITDGVRLEHRRFEGRASTYTQDYRINRDESASLFGEMMLEQN